LGWFRRKDEYYPPREKVPIAETYISLSTNRKVIKNLDEIENSRSKLEHWKSYPEDDPDRGFHDDQFISDMIPEDRMAVKHESLNKMLISLIMITSVLALGFAWMMNSTLGGFDGFLLSFIISGIIGGTILFGLAKRVSNEKKKDLSG